MKGVKMTGAQFNAFVNDPIWPEEAYWDDTLFRLNGEEVDDFDKIEPSDEIVILEGYVFLGGNNDTIMATTFARRWLKAQTHVVVMVTVPREQKDDLKNICMEMGWKAA